MSEANVPVMRLGDVAEVKAGFGFPEYLQGKATGPYPFYKVGDISEAWKARQVGLVAANHYVNDADLATLKARPLPAGAIVFAKIGAAIGLNRRCVLTQPGLVDNNVFGVVPKAGVANTKYLFQFMCSVDLMPLARATTVPSLRKGDVEELQLPMPSLARQQQVSDYLDEQLSRLDASVAALHRVQANLKRYRASVLKSACEGRLVPIEAELARHEGRDFEAGAQLLQRILVERRARLNGKGKYKEPVPAAATEMQKLPLGWSWATLEQLTFLVTSGSRGWSAFYADAGTWFIRAQDIKTDALNIHSVARVDVPAHAEGSRSSVGSSDILVTITGANVTKSALVPVLPEPAFVSQHVALLKLTCQATAAFVFNWIVSPANGRKVLESWAYGAGKPGLSLEQLRELRVALPPLAEQHRIVAEADRRLSLIRVAEAQVAANLARAKRLRQSILQAAFAHPGSAGQ